jgi:hypothetical protein
MGELPIIINSIKHSLKRAWCLDVYDCTIEPYEYSMKYFIFIKVKRGGVVHPGIKWHKAEWDFCDREISLYGSILYSIKASYKTEQVMNLWGYYNGVEGIYRHLSGRRGQCDPDQKPR